MPPIGHSSWKHHAVLDSRGIKIKVSKVRGHITEEQVQAGEHSRLNKVGNDLADAGASRGVGLIKHESESKNSLGSGTPEAHWC